MRLFAFRLALAFGCTVEKLLSSISKEEFYEWIAYYNIEPWGSIVDGYRSASIASTSANSILATVNPKKLRSNPYKIEDFLVGIKKQAPTQMDKVMTIRETLMNLAKNRSKNDS